MSQRIVLHVDMDQFFAACEILRKPELKGKPLVVGADPKGGRGRGVVSTCSYEARKLGVKSGMPISRAYKLCPDCVFLQPDFELYAEVSRRVMEILRSFAVKFESWGFDEAFLEVTGKTADFEEAEKLAREVKTAIKTATGLSCSVGVGPNKLVAKVASDFKKPGGLTIVRPDEVRAFLSPMPVRKLLWVGEKTEEALKVMGIELIGELAEADPALLFEKFGRMGPQLRFLAQGIDDSPLVETWEPKSVGSQRTFEQDTRDGKEILAKLDELCDEVFERFLGENALFKTVTVTVRFSGFETHTRAKSMKEAACGLEILKKTARELAAHFLEEGKPVRLVGVSVSGFVREKGQRKLGEF